MDFKYHGIILGKIDIGEADRVYTMYTKESGKVRLLGKGVRRPNARLAGSLEPLTYSEIFFARGRGRGNITGAIGLDFFPGVKSDSEIIGRVFFALEIFSRLITDEEKDGEIFELLLEYLEAMETEAGRDAPAGRLYGERNNVLDILSFGFLFKLLEQAGYSTEMGRCAVCKNRIGGDIFFSPRAGGVLCQVCAPRESEKIKISSGAVKIMRIFKKNDLKNFPKIIAEKKDVASLKSAVDSQIRWIF